MLQNYDNNYYFFLVYTFVGSLLCTERFSLGSPGRLPFTPSIRVEILGANIQCCSFSKRKMGRSENVLVSIGKFKRKRTNALIESIAYNFWNVSNGMVCTISFSNQNFRVFRVNGKRPRFPLPSKTKIWLDCVNCEFQLQCAQLVLQR